MSISDKFKFEFVLAVLMIWNLYYVPTANANPDINKICDSYKEVSAEVYWDSFYEIPFFAEKEEGKYIYARSRMRKPGCIKVKKDTLKEIGPRTRRAKYWMKIWINRSDYNRGLYTVVGEDGKSRNIGPKIIDQMHEVSGLSYKEQRKWQRWWKENKDFLVWSNEKGTLVIDDQAKQNAKDHSLPAPF